MVSAMPADIEDPERDLTRHEASQLRTDIANFEIGLEVIMAQIADCRPGGKCGAPPFSARSADRR
jgi:hypothetical protein